MEESERREYPRLASGVEVIYRLDDLSSTARQYLTGIAENYSFGGMFLVSDEPLKKGHILQLELLPNGEPPILATAVVKWVRRFRRPFGAGLKFIEFQNLGDREIHELMSRIFRV